MHGPSVQQLDKQRHRKSKKRRRAPPKSHNQHTSAVPPPVGTLYSFSAPLLHGEDSEEFRLSGGSSILPPLTSALTNTPSHDPRTPKDTLAQLYQRVGITPFETPPNQRLTRLYYESAGLLPSLSTTPESTLRKASNDSPTIPTTSVSVQPAALENWLDDWLQTRNTSAETNNPATSESRAVRVLMHLASRSGWRSRRGTRGNTEAPEADLQPVVNGTSAATEDIPEATEITEVITDLQTLANIHDVGNEREKERENGKQKAPTSTTGTNNKQKNARAALPHPNKYFLTPLFAHPDDHVLFSRKHWRAESAGGNAKQRKATEAPGQRRPIGGSAGSVVATSDFSQHTIPWGQLVPDRGPTFEPHMLLDPNEFGSLGRVDSAIDEGVENEEEDPAQVSLRCGLMLSTGMYLVRCVLYLSGATAIQINGISNPKTSGQTSSHHFSPGITLSGALSTARELNRNSHQSNSHTRVLLDTLEKARRIWFSRKRSKKKRGSKAGPLLFAAMASYAKPAKKSIPKSKKETDPSMSPTSEGNGGGSGSPELRRPSFHGHAPDGGRPHSNSRQERPRSSRNKNNRPSTTPHGWQPSNKQKKTPPSARVDTPSLRTRELLGSTGGTMSDWPPTSDLVKPGERSPSVDQGIKVPSKSVLPGNYNVVSPVTRSEKRTNENATSTKNIEKRTSTRMRSLSPMGSGDGRGGGAAGNLIEWKNRNNDDTDEKEEEQEIFAVAQQQVTFEAMLDEVETVKSFQLDTSLQLDGGQQIREKIFFKDKIIYRCCRKIDSNVGQTHFAAVEVIERTHMAMHGDGDTQLLVCATIPLLGNNSKTMTTVVSGMVLARIMCNNHSHILPMVALDKPLDQHQEKPRSIASEVSRLCMLVEDASGFEWCLILRVPEKYEEDEEDEEEYSPPRSRTASRPNSRAGSRPGSRESSRPGSRGSSRPGSRGSSRPGSRGSSRPHSRGRPRSRERTNSRERPSSRGRPRSRERPTSKERGRPKSRDSIRPRSRDSHSNRPHAHKKHHKTKHSKKRRKLNKKISQLAGKISTLVDRSQPIYMYVNRNNNEEKTSTSATISDLTNTSTTTLNNDGSETLDDITFDVKESVFSSTTVVSTPKASCEMATQTISFTAGEPLPSMSNLGGHPGSAVYLKPKVDPQCAVCGGELSKDDLGKQIGRFDVPVCSVCSPPTPRRELFLAPIVYETAAVLSGMEVELCVRSYGAGSREGIRFEAFDSLSANRGYQLDTTEKECLAILVEFNKSDLKIPDNFDPLETFHNAAHSEEYWSGLLLSLRLMPGKDRRTKTLALRQRKPSRPPKKTRKTRSVSPAKNERFSTVRTPPTGVEAGDSISSVNSRGSVGSMSSGASFDYRIHSLQKAKRAARSALIQAHEMKIQKDQESTHGPIVYSLSTIKLAGIVCQVDVRYNKGSNEIFFHATDENFKDYYLPTTLAECNENLVKLNELPLRPTTLDENNYSTVFHRVVKRLIWLEQVSATERRQKKLTINRPGLKTSRINYNELKKTRSLSPTKLFRRTSIRIIPPKKKKKPMYSSNMGTLEYKQEKELKRRHSSNALATHEEDNYRRRNEKQGPVVMTRDVKMAGFSCTVEIRNMEGSMNIFFHVKDDVHKEYFLSTTRDECVEKLQFNGWFDKLKLKEQNLDLFDLLPLFTKYLLWLEPKSSTERRAKILTLNRKGPVKKRVTLRKTRSMSPVPRATQDLIKKETSEAAMRAKREIVQAEIRAQEHEAIRRRAIEFGPVLYERKFKMAGIACVVQVRHQESTDQLLFHAIDDQLTEYELPATVNGCLSTMRVRGKRLSKTEFNMKQMVEMFVRYILWLEPVNETERRVKRLTLNRPPRKELRVSLTKESTFGQKPPTPAGNKTVVRRLDKADSMRYEAATRKLSLPELIPGKKSTLAECSKEISLAHCLKTIRSIEYEVSVFGQGPMGMTRLTFVATDEERDRTYRLNVSLEKAVSMLTDSEAATLLVENGMNKHNGAMTRFTDIKQVYTCVDAIRLYVDCLDVVRNRNGSTGGTALGAGMKLVMLGLDDA